MKDDIACGLSEAERAEYLYPGQVVLRGDEGLTYRMRAAYRSCE